MASTRKKHSKKTVALLDLKEASDQFEETLREAGYEVEAIGHKSAEIYNQTPSSPHVFVINLSIRGAKRILRHAKKLGSHIVVTANIFETDKIAKEMENGAEEFLIKGPGDDKELSKIVRKLSRIS